MRHVFQRANIMCDVDEILWPDPDRRRDDADADYPVHVLPLEIQVLYSAWTLLYMFCQRDISKVSFLSKTACIVLLSPIM